MSPEICNFTLFKDNAFGPLAKGVTNDDDDERGREQLLENLRGGKRRKSERVNGHDLKEGEHVESEFNGESKYMNHTFMTNSLY